MSVPASSPFPSDLESAEPLSPHEQGSNTLVSVVQFYASALNVERKRFERLRQQLLVTSTNVATFQADNERLRRELEAEKLSVEQARRDYEKLQVANGGVFLKLGDLLKALADEFEPYKLKPNAFDDTVLTRVYNAWLALRNERELVAQLVPECNDPARAPTVGS